MASMSPHQQFCLREHDLVLDSCSIRLQLFFKDDIQRSHHRRLCFSYQVNTMVFTVDLFITDILKKAKLVSTHRESPTLESVCC